MTTQMTVRIGFIERMSNRMTIVGYKSVRIGFANGKPTFEQQRVHLVAFDAMADTLQVVKGTRCTFEVQECRRRSDGTLYLKIIGQQVTQAAAPEVAAPEVAAVPVALDERSTDALINDVRNIDPVQGNLLAILASMHTAGARTKALNILRPLAGASFAPVA